jgi:hypothetical protein
MIPSDLAARLRFLREASLFETSPPVAGLQRARELQAQLQELLPGQRFFATLQRILPDGTFRALVAGQQLTLALNTAAQPGDTLELVATRVTPQMVLSRLATPGDAASAGSARPNLSPTGQLISFLLTGQPPAKPTALAGGQAFFNAPPTASSGAPGNPGNVVAAGAGNAAAVNAGNLGALGAQLAPLLRQALSQSGLFYESHQAQWLAGKIDLAALLREPQGQGTRAPTGNPATPGAQPAPSGTPTGTTASTQTAVAGQASEATSTSRAGQAAASNAIQSSARGEEAVARVSGATSQYSAMSNSPIAERLLPVVHQQLEALASQQYVWHGMAWPGQAFEWIVEDPRGEGHGEDETSGKEWDTTLRLMLPRLGGVEASVHLNAAGVALRLQVDGAAVAARLEAHREALAEALAAVGVPLTGMSVEYHDES